MTSTQTKTDGKTEKDENENQTNEPKIMTDKEVIKSEHHVVELECHEGEDNCFKCHGSGVVYVSDGIYGHCDECCDEFFPSNCHQDCQVQLNARNMCE
jgi:hypothetical protein